ncbi:MAG: flavodoxin [Bacteroidales bacterium]|nr:flavodoxin [Bacteroidales bacterium]
MKDSLRIGIFYGTSSGNTRQVAGLIAAGLGKQAKLVDVEFAKVSDIEMFDLLIFGTSTWGMGDVQYDWGKYLILTKKVNLSEKTIAFFGLGDQSNYPECYQDGMGILYEHFKDKARIIGYWPSESYRFTQSKAVIGNMFVGLAIDQDNEALLTPERIKQWCALLRNEMNSEQTI